MMGSGSMIKNMELVSINILTRLSTMVNGKMMFAKDMELITIQMVIDMKGSGIRICKMEAAHITILMAIFIKVSG
jgi:hypothetical protein